MEYDDQSRMLENWLALLILKMIYDESKVFFGSAILRSDYNDVNKSDNQLFSEEC